MQDKGSTVFRTYDEAYQALELDIGMLCLSGVIFECRPVRVLRHVRPDVERLSDLIEVPKKPEQH